MPITLMTGYFSIQFVNTTFTVKSYWWAFAIIFVVSIVLLFLFSFFSGTFEGRIVNKPWSRIVYDFSKKWWTHRRTKGKTF